MIPVFHIESTLVKRFLIGFAVNNFPVLYEKLDHVVMATKLIDKMLPPTTEHTIRREFFKSKNKEWTKVSVSKVTIGLRQRPSETLSLIFINLKITAVVIEVVKLTFRALAKNAMRSVSVTKLLRRPGVGEGGGDLPCEKVGDVRRKKIELNP